MPSPYKQQAFKRAHTLCPNESREMCPKITKSPYKTILIASSPSTCNALVYVQPPKSASIPFIQTRFRRLPAPPPALKFQSRCRCCCCRILPRCARDFNTYRGCPSGGPLRNGLSGLPRAYARGGTRLGGGIEARALCLPVQWKKSERSPP